MKSIFVIRNQHGLYLSRQNEWLEGREAAALFRTPHRDEAVNAVFEASLRDVAVRAEVVACRLDERNLPRVDDRVAPPARATDETGDTDGAAAAQEQEQEQEPDTGSASAESAGLTR